MKVENLIYAWLHTLSTDLDGLGAFLTEDAVAEFPYAPRAGLVGRVEGRAAIVQHLRDTFAGYGLANLRYEDLRIHPGADPETAWFEVHATADLPAGERFEQDYVLHLRSKSGRITLYREYGNMLAVPRVAAPAGTSVLVIGGTGKTGAPLVRKLREQGIEAYAASRSGERRFDWTDPATWDAALIGVDRLYVVAPLVDPHTHMIPFFQLALSRGVRRVVLLSSTAVTDETPGLGEVARWVRLNVPEWTVLRSSRLIQSFVDPSALHAQTIASDELIVSATGEGRIPFVDAEDVAAVAARALTDEAPHQAEHVVTGPAGLSFDAVAELLGVRHVALGPQDFATFLCSTGIRPGYANLLTLLDTLVADGEHAEVTDTVLRVTGRAPRSFVDVVRSVRGN